MIEALSVQFEDLCAETDAEAKDLFELAKRSSRISDSEWYSRDGRQLGQPFRKAYELSVLSDGANAAASADTSDCKNGSIHEMHVDIVNSEMRVSTMFTESHFY